MENWIIWLVILIFLIIIELATINLVTIWFVISGVLALITSLYIDNVKLELFIFVIGGVILLFLTRPLLNKLIKKEKIKTNIDRIIGMKGLVTKQIDKNSSGIVKIEGKEWTAYSNEKIEEGQIVKILEIKGVKLKVRKEEE